MKISLIVPMYNEMDIVEDAIKTYASYLGAHFADWELIFVSDGSTDGCGDAVTRASSQDSRIRLCSYMPNRGKGYAVRTGMLAASGDIRLFTDCDNAYGTEVIGQIAAQMAAGEDDLVVGSRNLRGDGYEGYTWLRRVASKAYIKVIALAAGFRLSDSQCGFKCFRAAAAERIFRNCRVDRFAFDLEVIMIAQKLSYKIGEMPVRVINHRESKVHVFSDAFKMLRDVRLMKKRIRSEELQ